MAASSPYIWPDTVSQSEHMDPEKKNLIKEIQGNLSRIPFYGLRGAKDQRACEPGGYLAIKRLTIFPTIYLWRPVALTFGWTLSVS